MPKAHRFSDRILVQRQSGGDLDAYGNASAPSWDALSGGGEFWGDLRETPGRERVAAGRIEAPATATLRLRRSPASLAIEAGDRVLARGATWAIVSSPIDPDGTRTMIEVTLERGRAVQ